MRRGRPLPRLLAALLLLAGVGWLVVLLGERLAGRRPHTKTLSEEHHGPGGRAGGIEREGARIVALEAELAAARSDRLYLVLDAGGAWLDLKADGLLLHRFEVERALFGRPRLGSGSPAWPAASFELASELPEPDRPQVPIEKPDPADEAAAARPAGDPLRARREAALAAVPTHYRLRFEPGLELAVRGESGVAALPDRVWRLRHRLLEGWGTLAHWARGEAAPPRVVLVLPPGEARRLFLALLPETRLVVAVPARPASP